MLLGIFAVQPGAVEQGVTRLVVQDEIILRIPIQPRPLRPFQWEERKGPKCVPVNQLRGALLSGPESVDFIFNNRARIRAHFDEDCLGLDFYRGFYVQPKGDRLCAGKDAIYSRMGTSCTIERFKSLVPKFAGR